MNQEVASIQKGPRCSGFPVEEEFFGVFFVVWGFFLVCVRCVVFLTWKKSEMLCKHFTTCKSASIESSKLRLKFSSTLLITDTTNPGPAVLLCLQFRCAFICRGGYYTGFCHTQSLQSIFTTM